MRMNMNNMSGRTGRNVRGRTDRNVCPTDRQECLSYRRGQGRRRGFTLVELLVCTMLFMLVSFGISHVFGLTRITVATGQKIAEMTRDARAATATMWQDGQRWLSTDPVSPKDPPPLFFIRSIKENITDVTGATRAARRDMIGFPLRGSFRRVTGDPGMFINTDASSEAWVWYGHCNSLTGGQTNIIGRVATLLLDPNSIPNTVNFYQRDGNSLSPLRADSVSQTNRAASSYTLNTSRYDLAGTTIAQLKTDVGTYNQAQSIPAAENLIFRYQASERMVDMNNLSASAIPPTSDSYSRTTPVFLRNAPELIIEFAGDFVTQDPVTGDITDSKPDGIIDFAVVRTSAGAIQSPMQRRTQWFGMYRDQLTTDGREWTAEPLSRWIQDHWSKSGRALTATDLPLFERRTAAANAVGSDSLWVWVNKSPKQVRMLFKQDDPEVLIRDGPWTEVIIGPQ